MPTESIVNGSQFVTLEEALAGEHQAPPLTSEFSVLLVGALKLEDGDAEGNCVPSVRLYPADGREDQYYLIKKTDIDTDRVELVSPDLVAARGWIAEKVVRIRVRASAQLFSVHSRTIEASKLSEEAVPSTSICNGTSCTAPYVCRPHPTFGRACINSLNGSVVPCPNCH